MAQKKLLSFLVTVIFVFFTVNCNAESEQKLLENQKDRVVLKVFVSSSMGNQLLKDYVKEAKRYSGILVFNGLPGNSWVKLHKMVKEIVEDQGAVAIQIDPEEFDRFNIKIVPAFVLMKEENRMTGFSKISESSVIYDKVTGNIGVGGALRLFAQSGELSRTAKEKLISND